jgi:hypothetical protein
MLLSPISSRTQLVAPKVIVSPHPAIPSPTSSKDGGCRANPGLSGWVRRLRGGGVVDPVAEVDQARVRRGVLAVVAEWRGGCAGVFGRAVGVVAVGAFRFARRSGEEACRAGLVVMQVGHGAGGVVDLLDCGLARTVHAVHAPAVGGAGSSWVSSRQIMTSTSIATSLSAAH